MSRARDFADLAGSADAGGLTGANALINGQFSVAQRGTSFTSGSNDDTDYTLDRWKLFSDGNDVVDVTQETTTVPTNRQYAIALDVETANKKFGIAQIIEQKNCVNLIGETVTLSFQAKVSATTNLDNVKAAIIAWDGTADTVTADMISAWGAEGTDPTLATNFTYENTPANLNLTTSYATYSVTASVDTASAKNIIVFIWSDVTTTSAGEFLYLSDVKLEAGAAATPYQHEDFNTTYTKCLRYYETSYATGTAPGTSGGFTSMPSRAANSVNDTTQEWTLKVRKRGTMTVTIYGTAGTSGQAYVQSLSADVAASVENGANLDHFRIYRNGGSNWTADTFVSANWECSAEL